MFAYEKYCLMSILRGGAGSPPMIDESNCANEVGCPTTETHVKGR